VSRPGRLTTDDAIATLSRFVPSPERIRSLTLRLVVAGGAAALPAARRRSRHAKGRVADRRRGAPSGGNPTGGSGSFTLRSGSATDGGSESYSFFDSLHKGTVTLTGKHGGLVLRTSSRPSGLSVDSQGLDLWTGTWTIVSGTGVYAGAHGVGAYVGIVGPAYRLRSTSRASGRSEVQRPLDAVS
jgi:hypothetical protein